ncbi:hypothetical protein [Streptomyces sp. YIM S03343]
MTGRDEYGGAEAGSASGGGGGSGGYGGSGAGVPDWASAETQAANTPPPWAVAQTQTGIPVPPPPPASTPTPAPAPAPSAPPAPTPAPAPAPSAPPAPTGEPSPYTPPAFPTQPPAYTLTPTTPEPPQPPALARGVGRIAGLVALAVVAGAGAGTGVWYAARGHSGDTAGPATSVSVTAPAPSGTPSAAGTTPPVSPSDTSLATTPASEYASASAAPGYRTAEDPVGYTLDVPQGWKRRQEQGEKAPVVYYDSPSDGRQLQIFALAEATPAESLDLAENAPGYGFAHQPGYQVQDRTSGDTWAEVSYRYDDKDKGARLVVDHRFQAADGTLYAFRTSGPEDLGPALVRGPLTTALASFCPSGGSGCS